MRALILTAWLIKFWLFLISIEFCELPIWSLSFISIPNKSLQVLNKSLLLSNATPRLSKAILILLNKVLGAFTRLLAEPIIWLIEVEKSPRLSPAPATALAVWLIVVATSVRVSTALSNFSLLDVYWQNLGKSFGSNFH